GPVPIMQPPAVAFAYPCVRDPAEAGAGGFPMAAVPDVIPAAPAPVPAEPDVADRRRRPDELHFRSARCHADRFPPLAVCRYGRDWRRHTAGERSARCGDEQGISNETD